MARQRYDHWTIRVFEGSDSFGDLTGYDEAASISRFCEYLQNILIGRFPGAEVDVEQVDSTLRPVEVYPADPDDDEGEQAVLAEVDRLRDLLFTGHLGDWSVPAKEVNRA